MIAFCAESDNIVFPEGEVDLQVTETDVFVTRIKSAGEPTDFVVLWKKAAAYIQATYLGLPISVIVSGDRPELKALFDRMSVMEYQHSVYRLKG